MHVSHCRGDLVSIQRLGYEFVEDCSKHGIIYAEARFCPHILIPDDIIAEQKSLVSQYAICYFFYESLIYFDCSGRVNPIQ